MSDTDAPATIVALHGRHSQQSACIFHRPDEQNALLNGRADEISVSSTWVAPSASPETSSRE
eukprot:scaffold407633_cov19-Prasinocladus_malaysianus.AAC.1